MLAILAEGLEEGYILPLDLASRTGVATKASFFFSLRLLTTDEIHRTFHIILLRHTETPSSPPVCQQGYPI